MANRVRDGGPEHCPNCGAKMYEHQHRLSKGVVRALWKLAAAGGGPLNISDDLDLTKSEYTNFSKGKYWELIEKDSSRGERGGFWRLTDKGWLFMQGELELHQIAWTWRDEVVELEGELVGVDDITEGYRYRPEYARDARPHR